MRRELSLDPFNRYHMAPLVKRDVAKALNQEQLVPREEKAKVVDLVEDIDTIKVKKTVPEVSLPIVNFYTHGRSGIHAGC